MCHERVGFFFSICVAFNSRALSIVRPKCYVVPKLSVYYVLG